MGFCGVKDMVQVGILPRGLKITVDEGLFDFWLR
jgi:hypothetical protein